MSFRRVRRKSPAVLLILFCFVTRPINCQKTLENLTPTVVTPSATTNAWRHLSFSRAGLTISNQDGTSYARVHGYLEADGRFFATNLKDQRHDQLLFRRVRPIVEGKLTGSVSFRFMPDFGEGLVVIQEVFTDWKPVSAAGLSLGKFKTPLGLEILRPDPDLTFSERSLASDLLPIRDLGAQVDGSFFQNAVTYELGFLSGTADGTNANFEWRGTNEAVARAVFQPFAANARAALRQLGIGIALSNGHSRGDLPCFKTIGQQTFFRYAPGTFADGQHKRASPQAYYYFGSFGLLAEYVISGQTVATDTARRYLSNRGWEVAGSFVLTGEKNSYDSIQPAHAFEPAAGLQHMGAWEIAFRHSALDVDRSAFPVYAAPADSARQAGESAVGLNWYVNRYAKVMADFEYTSFHMVTNTIPRLCPERVLMTRLQFSF